MSQITLLFAAALLATPATHARHQVELESTYLGDGWFQYRLRAPDDPFFIFFDLTGLIVPFPGYTERVPDAPDWSSTIQGEPDWPETTINWSYPDCGHVACQTRPYERVFLARSDKRHFKRRQNAVVLMSLAMVGGYHGPYTTLNMVGYANINGLFPCDPHEADGSATNLLERLELINLPDPQIGTLIRTGTEIRGITFDYDEPSTVRLEATRDFGRWTNVAYIYGNAGTTSWTTNLALNQFGDFFRLRLIAEGHASSLPPLNGPSVESAQLSQPPKVAANSDGARVLSCRPRGEQLEVKVKTPTGTRHVVKLVSSSGEVQQTRTIDGSGAVTELIFNAPMPGPVFVTMTPAP